MSLGEPTVPQWLCWCCYVLLVNGDGCQCPEHQKRDSRGRFQANTPLSAFPRGMPVTPGMLPEYHEDGCLWRDAPNVPGDYECDCETRSFSWSACDGCNSNLGGARYAATGWIGEKKS